MTAHDPRAVAPVFDPTRLKLAREARGLTKGELAREIGVTPAAVGQFERGAARPKASTLAQLALVLKFPVGFFAFTGVPVKQPDVADTFFRSLRRTKQKDRQRAIAHATLVALLFEALEQHLHLPDVDIPDDLHVAEETPLSEVERIAEEVRARWRVTDGPIKHVVRLLESKGIAVVRYQGDRDIDAFSAWFASRPIVVLAESKANFERSRLDAAHELGHLVMHADPAPGDRGLERQAFRFGSAFLMPRGEIIDELPSHPIDWRRLIATKRKWGVSLQALLYRGRDLSVLSESDYENAMRTISRRGWRRSEPGHLGPPEEPRLVQAAIDKLAEIGMTIDDLGDETSLGRRVVEELQGATRTPIVTP